MFHVKCLFTLTIVKAGANSALRCFHSAPVVMNGFSLNKGSCLACTLKSSMYSLIGVNVYDRTYCLTHCIISKIFKIFHVNVDN